MVHFHSSIVQNLCQFLQFATIRIKGDCHFGVIRPASCGPYAGMPDSSPYRRSRLRPKKDARPVRYVHIQYIDEMFADDLKKEKRRQSTYK